MTFTLFMIWLLSCFFFASGVGVIYWAFNEYNDRDFLWSKTDFMFAVLLALLGLAVMAVSITFVVLGTDIVFDERDCVASGYTWMDGTCYSELVEVTP